MIKKEKVGLPEEKVMFTKSIAYNYLEKRVYVLAVSFQNCHAEKL